MCWLGQSLNAGAWTYYESRPDPVKKTMMATLRDLAPAGVADCFEQGARDWGDETKIAEVDEWIIANERTVNSWLRALATENRAALVELTG